MDPRELYSTTDAHVWAKEFIRMKNLHNFDIDEDLMIGWFANAIETGRSAGIREASAKS